MPVRSRHFPNQHAFRTAGLCQVSRAHTYDASRILCNETIVHLKRLAVQRILLSLPSKRRRYDRQMLRIGFGLEPRFELCGFEPPSLCVAWLAARNTIMFHRCNFSVYAWFCTRPAPAPRLKLCYNNNNNNNIHLVRESYLWYENLIFAL